jgi:hypothetical protein
MPRKSVPAFVINVPVSKAMLDRAIEASLYDIDDFDAQHFKAAGFTKAKLKQDLAGNPVFIQRITRQMVKSALDSIENEIRHGDIGHGEHSLITTATLALEKADREAAARDEARWEAARKAENAKAAADRIKNAAKLLKEAGYQVVKA